MTSCYICSSEYTVKITYKDSLGNINTEKRCDVCADALESNKENTILSKTNKSKQKTSSDVYKPTQYRGKIHKSYSKNPDLIKSNNILL